ncbi:Kinesin-associated protein 3 [Geodia barretti]|uniref:Kinesin-associated protein 3 n=3 Tax=Geodia barretti TaxID=519541 RepID=A0AA35XKF0_GEOBA|nr:Kinesin-associated protein 3 [Geodia barretti]
MCKGPGLKMLMRRALNTGDPLLLKMLRNISLHSGAIKKPFLGYIPDLVEMMKRGTGEEEEGAVEAAGILGNLNIPDLDFGKIVHDMQLLPFLTGKLKDLSLNDDMLLELVVLCGTFSQDESCAVLLVDAGLPQLLITCLKERQEEDELVLQIVYVFYYLVLHQATRQTVLSTSQAPEYLLELMSDKNKAVSDLCIKTLDIIAEEDSELGQRVKTNRFRWHNCNWLEIVTGESLYEEEDEEEEEDEDYLDLLRSAAELDEPDYFYSSPDGAPVTVPVGEMDNFERDRFLLQHYGVPPPTVAHSPAGYGDSLVENSPHYYGAQLGANHAVVSSSPYPPRPMSRADNPLASPGMLFDREYDNEVEPTSISARQLMSSLEDPLAMYNASFKTDLDMNQSVDNDDSVDDVGYSTGHPGTNYSTVLEGGMGQTQQRGSSNRVGF